MSDAFLPSTVRFTNRVINWLRTKPRLYDSVLRLAKWHDRAMDFRKYGLMIDDLIPEEHEIVYKALERLTDKEMFDRTFRLRRAVQLSLTKETLPPSEWIPLEKDIRYLWRHIDAISQEEGERKAFDSGKYSF